MRRILFSPQADADLNSIWDYIAEDSAERADSVYSEINATIHLLAHSPGIGHTRSDVDDPAFRFRSVYSYLVAYQYDDEMLHVVRVIHGAREFRSIFGG